MVKDALLADTLSLVAPPYFDRGIWREMLRWRVGERGAGGRSLPSLSAELFAARQRVDYIRTHDVGQLNQALKVAVHLNSFL